MENIFVNKNMFNFDEETLKKIKQTVEEINNNKIGIEEVIKHYYGCDEGTIEKIHEDFYDSDNCDDEEDVNMKEEKKMTFEDAYDMCPIEMQMRYNYLDQLLCNIDDEMMYLTEEIERAKVDEEVAEKMWKNGFESARDKMIEANRERVQLNRRLKYLEEEYEITLDLYDEILINILANIE